MPRPQDALLPISLVLSSACLHSPHQSFAALSLPNTSPDPEELFAMLRAGSHNLSCETLISGTLTFLSLLLFSVMTCPPLSHVPWKGAEEQWWHHGRHLDLMQESSLVCPLTRHSVPLEWTLYTAGEFGHRNPSLHCKESWFVPTSTHWPHSDL